MHFDAIIWLHERRDFTGEEEGAGGRTDGAAGMRPHPAGVGVSSRGAAAGRLNYEMIDLLHLT